MAFSKERERLLRREGVDGTTLQLLSKTDELAQARKKHEDAERELMQRVADRDAAINELQTKGVERVAMTGALSFGLGGGLAYLLHDEVAAYFGKGTLPALLAIPGAGVVGLALTRKYAKKRRASVESRAGAYGFSLGLIAVGGYLSYQDYEATPASP